MIIERRRDPDVAHFISAARHTYAAGPLSRYDYHGYLHMLLGGAWDCKQSLDYTKLQKELNLANLPTYIEDLAMNMNVLWRYFFLAGYLKVNRDAMCDDSVMSLL